MYWTNSNVTTTQPDAVETSQESNQSQYPKLSATEIEKVLYLSGMTDAGRFEAIIANIDTAGLLAMFGMSYAELKEILVIPDDRLATPPDKEAQLVTDKAIAIAPESLSPYPPLPKMTFFTGVENDGPILPNTESQAEHVDESSATIPTESNSAIVPVAPAKPDEPEPHTGITDVAPLTGMNILNQDNKTQAGDHDDVPAAGANNLPIPIAPTPPAPVPPPGPGPFVVNPAPVIAPVVPEPVLPPVVTEPVLPPVVTEPVLPPVVTEPVLPPVVTEPVLPPVVTEPVLPPVVTEPVLPPVVTEPVLPPVVTEPVLPPAPGSVVVVPETGPVLAAPETAPPQAPPLSQTQPETNVGGGIETGHGETGQTGSADGGSGFAGGAETGSKLGADAGLKSSTSSSSSITSPPGLGLNGSGLSLDIGSGSSGVILGVAAGKVAHSISSGDFGFSFGGGGGGGGSRNHQDEQDTHNDAGGPGTTPLPPLIQIGQPPPDTNVHEVINNPPAPAPVLPLPPNELPGPGDMQDDDFIIDGVIDAINQHAGDAPADGGSEQGDQDHGHDGGDAHDNAPGPVPPPVNQDANINGAYAFIAHARAEITRMQAETIAAHVLVDEATVRHHAAQHAIDQAQVVLDQIESMVERGIDFIPTDYERFAAANTEIERCMTILNATDTLINDKEVLIHQKTAEINIMRALIAQAQARIPGWGEQPGIADANANLDNAAGEDAANGGHANDFDEDVDIGGLPDGGNAGLNHAGDQPVEEPDADLPLNIVIANEVIAQGNALIDALRAHVALRQTDIARNARLIFDRENNITWLQDKRIAGVEHTSYKDGNPLSGPDLINWLRSIITNTQAQISEAQADRDRTLNDIAQLQGQIAHAQAEIDAWFHHHQNNAPGEHLLPDAPQGVAPVDGVLLLNALVHQDDAPASVQDAGAVIPPAYITAAYAHIAQANATIAALEGLNDEAEMDFDVAENRSHELQEILTAESHARADLLDNFNNGIATNDQTTATLTQIETTLANIARDQALDHDAQTDMTSAEAIFQITQAAIRHQETVIAQSEAVIAAWQRQQGPENAHVDGQINQVIQPPQNISLALQLAPAPQTPAATPAGNAAIEVPLHYGTADMITPYSVTLGFEFRAPSDASTPADFIHRSNDIHAIQGVLAHWMDSIDPGFAATVVAFDKVDMSDAGDMLLQVLVRDMPVIPDPATLMALQNAMQDYLDKPDSPAPEHPENLDGTTHQALSLVGQAENSGQVAPAPSL